MGAQGVPQGTTVWFTGLPASGKSTLAERTREHLTLAGVPSVILDGDEVRDSLVPAPGYSAEARDAFYATLARLAGLLARQGLVVLVPATANLRSYRDRARAYSPRFVEVYVSTPEETCAARDPKGLYARARADPSSTLPGVGATYEPPLSPEVVAEGGTDERAVRAIAAILRSL